MMNNEPKPLYLFRDYSRDVGAIFGLPQNASKYESLFLVTHETIFYERNKGLHTGEAAQQMMAKACEAAYQTLSKALEKAICDSDVPTECRTHRCFGSDGVLKHIDPEFDGQWICLSGVTPEDIQAVFMKNFRTN